MSIEQQDLYIVNQLTLTAIMLGSTLGSLVLSFILFFVQFTIEGQRLRREALASKARRLRHKADDKAVTAPQLPFSSMMPAAKFFHLFLSHVWGTGASSLARSAAASTHVPSSHIPVLTWPVLTWPAH